MPARREISNSKRVVGILKSDGRLRTFSLPSQYAVRFVSVLACLNDEMIRLRVEKLIFELKIDF